MCCLAKSSRKRPRKYPRSWHEWNPDCVWQGVLYGRAVVTGDLKGPGAKQPRVPNRPPGFKIKVLVIKPGCSLPRDREARWSRSWCSRTIPPAPEHETHVQLDETADAITPETFFVLVKRLGGVGAILGDAYPEKLGETRETGLPPNIPNYLQLATGRGQSDPTRSRDPVVYSPSTTDDVERTSGLRSCD